MRRIKIPAAAAVLTAMTLMMSACGSKTAASTVSSAAQSDSAAASSAAESTTVSASTETQTQSDNNIMGHVTKIDGNSVTMTLAEQNGEHGRGQTLTDGNKRSGDKKTGKGKAPADKEKPDSTETADGTDHADEGPGQNGGGKSGIKLSGKTKTVTVSAATKYILSDGSSGNLSDIKADDHVTVKMDGDTVESITVMDMSKQPDPGQAPKDGKPGDNNGGTDTSSETTTSK